MKRFFIFFFAILFSFSAFSEGTVYFYPGAFGNSLFDINDPDLNRVPMCMMREAILRLGYKIKTIKSFRGLTDVACVICFDVPLSSLRELEWFEEKEKLILFLWEPPSTKPYNYNKEHHKHFAKVYTLLDDLVDNKKYFKFYEPQPRFDVLESVFSFEQKKLSVLITRNLKKSHPLSLTPERQGLVDFFEPLDEREFDFYGYGWKANCSKNCQGVTPSKVDTMRDYRFCFCYENMHGINGYITGAKIFNVFAAGCVPIYWGAKNITDYVPANCFIDRRGFDNNQEVYDFIKNMTEQEHEEYIKNIKEFMSSAQAHLFSPEIFTHIFINAIEPGYNKDIALTERQKNIVEWVSSYLKEGKEEQNFFIEL